MWKSEFGIYFGNETSGKVSGKIYMTNGKTLKGEFEIEKDVFKPIEGTLFPMSFKKENGKLENLLFVVDKISWYQILKFVFH